VKIIEARPPIYDRIVKAIGKPSATVVYTWGDAIYSPSGCDLSKDVVIHESVHSLQQAAVGGPELWWARYLSDPAFRFVQEAQAYRTQYGWICQRTDRSGRRRALRILAKDLASPMYGNLVSKAAAMEAIGG
jgi:hypothetical protein